MVEKGINFILCLGTTYDVSSMESIGNYSVIFVDGKSMPLKIFFISQFKLWALAPLQISASLYEGPIYYLLSKKNWVSIFNYNAPTREHCYHTCAMGITNIWVCFMNGSIIEHNGLGIAFFSVDILKDMIACWYAWVLMSSCQI